MSSVLPKEKQTAYQRWELASFDEEPPMLAPAPPPPPPAPEPLQLSAESIANFNAEIEVLRNEAWQQGYADGIAEGTAEGHSQGLNEGREQAATEFTRLQQIAAAFAGEVAHANEAIAEDLLNLALDVAKAMLKTALQVKPELVLPIVGEAVRYLPSLQQPALLFLHPSDAHLVKEHMEDELTKAGWRVAEDMHLEPGGCRIETASNQIDASLSGRWERLASSLSKEPGWLKE
jgi:flagellar assembly protein FliH